MQNNVLYFEHPTVALNTKAGQLSRVETSSERELFVLVGPNEIGLLTLFLEELVLSCDEVMECIGERKLASMKATTDGLSEKIDLLGLKIGYNTHSTEFLLLDMWLYYEWREKQNSKL